MSKPTNRETAPRAGGSVDHRLARLFDSPALVRIVPHLAPETLHQLIQYRGLDACVELVTAATPAQVTSLLDLDLWRHPQPGADEQFDAARFGEWLETLVDANEEAAARIVATLDRQVAIAGLSRYVRVFDPGTFEPTESTDDEPLTRHERMNSETSADVAECEVGGYLVRARRPDAWSAIVTLLVTLETDHDRDFHALMEGCRRLSNSRPEADGLDDLLMIPEQFHHDVSIAREQRRSRQGYATPADARAFLQMARQPRQPLSRQPSPQQRQQQTMAGGPEVSTQAAMSARAPAASTAVNAAAPPSRAAAAADARARNPIATAYFRAAEEAAAAEADMKTGADADAETATVRRESSVVDAGGNDDEIPALIGAISDLLAEAGLVPERPRALLGAADAGEAADAASTANAATAEHAANAENAADAAAGDRPAASKLPLLQRLMAFVQRHDEAAHLARGRELAFLANTLVAGSSVQTRPFTPPEASDAVASICNLGLEHWPARWPDAPAQEDADASRQRAYVELDTPTPLAPAAHVPAARASTLSTQVPAADGPRAERPRAPMPPATPFFATPPFAAPPVATSPAATPPSAAPPPSPPPLTTPSATPPDTLLLERDLITAFEVGWSVLYHEVSLFVADQLTSILAELHDADTGLDADTRHGLRALRRELLKQRDAGTPWLARDAADVLATLDMTAWISVLGLLDECPILPAALTAVLERRTTAVSATAFDFISTTAQLGDVRLFMRTLPRLLSR